MSREECDWGKFREASGILTKKEGSVIESVRSTVIYGSKTWAMDSEQIRQLE